MIKYPLLFRPNFSDPAIERDGYLTLHTVRQEDDDPAVNVGTFMLQVKEHGHVEVPEQNKEIHRLVGKVLTGETVTYTLVYDNANLTQELIIDSAEEPSAAVAEE